MVSPLKVLRVSQGLSQLDLAELAGISREQISKIEGGKVDPRVSTLFTLARALQCDVAQVFHDEREATNLPDAKIGQDGPTNGT